MSQDSQRCPKCRKPSGYDDEKGFWPGGNLRICGKCKHNLITRFCVFFGLEGVSSTDMGLEIEWHEVDRILGRIKKDYAMRVSYLVTDKERWEKEVKRNTPIERG